MGQQLHGPVWTGELHGAHHQAQEGRWPGRSRHSADLSRYLPQPGVDGPPQRQVSYRQSKYTSDSSDPSYKGGVHIAGRGGRLMSQHLCRLHNISRRSVTTRETYSSVLQSNYTDAVRVSSFLDQSEAFVSFFDSYCEMR